jgi:diguanylate cyclase (GGDEF)-like protein
MHSRKVIASVQIDQPVNERIVPVSEARDDDQTLADRDQSLADADREASESDQTAAGREQAAADSDQAASDRDLVHGGDPAVHDSSRKVRNRSAQQRQYSAHGRVEAAEARDQVAGARDLAALARDQAADLRDHELVAREDASEGNGAEVLLRAEDRRTVAAERAVAAEGRARAAADREQAARDREQAARDRLQAQADRDALLDQLAIAKTDGLTGTRSRATGLEDFNHEIDRAHRTMAPLVIAYVDVVGLKVVNDTHGHAAGDELLQRAVNAIRDHLRSYDLIVRIGGDEFLTVMSGATLKDVRQRFDAIQSALAADPDPCEIKVGFAALEADDSATELIKRADAELPTSDRR